MGLHPVWVILVPAVAGYFWGFVGPLLAIPLSGLIRMLVRLDLARYERSQLLRGREAALTAAAQRRLL